MSVTADTVRYTADAHYPTADGFVPANIILAEVVEPAGASSGTHVTADSVLFTADSHYPTADGLVPGNSIPAEVVDAIVIAADAAVMVEAAAAADVLDATVEAAEAPVYGGARHYPPKPFPVIGVGFGILPALEGEAHGVVTLVGVGIGTLPGLTGEAAGTAGVAGRSAAQLVLRAAAVGTRGQAGNAAAVLEGLSVASAGVVGSRGSGSGTVMKFRAAASGRHDDDEAAIVAWLLAA
jgi:hypothetical protein